jgi:hypothetical protein
MGRSRVALATVERDQMGPLLADGPRGADRNGVPMGTVISIEVARRRRVVSRFCTRCRKPWGLIAIRRDHALVVLCKFCGHVRGPIPAQDAAQAARNSRPACPRGPLGDG